MKTEQDDTSLADRFSRGGLPFTVGQLHGGIAMEEESTYADVLQSNEDELDETRSNEAHLRQAAYLQDPCSPQGPCPSKPFEGLEQCLSWHQQVWDYLSLGCPCCRRRCMRFQFEEQPQSQVVDGYASHREYPILKPPHTTNQALTRVRDRVQDQAQSYGIARMDRAPGIPPYSAGMDMRSGGTTSNKDRISGMSHDANARHTGSDTSNGIQEYHQHTRPADFCLAETGKTQKE